MTHLKIHSAMTQRPALHTAIASLVAMSLLLAACSNDEGTKGGASSENENSSPENATEDLVREISAGAHHTCAVTEQRSVMCWGSNDMGQLGSATIPTENGDSDDTDFTSTAVAVDDVGNVVEISAGYAHTCALRSGGDVVCWGRDRLGRLGANWSSLEAPFSTEPVSVPELDDVRTIASGDGVVCAIKLDNTVWCWSPADLDTPLELPALRGATELALTERTICALLKDRTVGCVGDAQDGTLGNGTTDYEDNIDPSASIPSAVAGLEDVEQIAAGSDFVCAMLGDGSVWCWGSNSEGQLGNASVATYSEGADTDYTASTPVRAEGISDAVRIDAGLYHVCATLIERNARCWGSSSVGQLGDPSIPFTTTPDGVADALSVAPVEVAGLRDVVRTTGGWSHTCAILMNRSVWCWGLNGDGQLGTESVPDRRSAEPPETISAEPAQVTL